MQSPMHQGFLLSTEECLMAASDFLYTLVFIIRVRGFFVAI